MKAKKQIMWRVYVIYILLCLIGMLVMYRIFAIQHLEDHSEIEIGEQDEIVVKEIKPIRGTIFTDGAEILASSDPHYDIRWDATVVRDEVFAEKADSLAGKLSSLFKDRSKEGYLKLLHKARRENRRYELIQRSVSGREFKQLSLFPIFRLGQFKGGVIAEKKERRLRPFGLLAARTVGYEREGIQPVGLEGAFSEDLSGVVGLQKMQKIGGRWRPATHTYKREPRNGNDVYTSIDIQIQSVAESELLRQLNEQDAEHGCAILMEVETGFIKAIANLSRDENGNYYEVYNHAVGRSTEPGSTFKTASLMAALEDGKISIGSDGRISKGDSVDTENGTHQFYDQTMRDHKAGYGWLSVEEVLAYSSNVGVSKLIYEAYKNEPQKFIDRIKGFGMGAKTGISIAGEGTPYIKDANDESWSGVSLPWMSIGYEVRLTPLQILTFYNAIANNGKMVRPQLVKEVRYRGDVVRQYEPDVVNPMMCSPSTIRAARRMLEAVVDYGTGKQLQGASFTVAGKTGTTQIAKDGGGYGDHSNVRHQASFVGYFPADNPKYSCIVVIAAPNKNIYGSSVSGTVFKEIANKVYATSVEYHEAINNSEKVGSELPPLKAGYHQSTRRVLEQLGFRYDGQPDADWITAKSTEKKYILQSKSMASSDRMPDVRGMGLSDALYLLEESGLEVSVSGSGKVVSQSIETGQTISKGQHVQIELRE